MKTRDEIQALVDTLRADGELSETAEQKADRESRQAATASAAEIRKRHR